MIESTGPVTTDDSISDNKNMNDFEILTDANALYRGYLAARRNSRWKPQVQSFEWNFLDKISMLQEELKNGTYKTSQFSEFIINERGKTRPITGLQIRDRIVRHVLCDEILLPRVMKSIIYDNSASLKNRGIDFARNRLKVHLHQYYQQYKTNEGYILLIDFSKYYDNIRHDIAIEQLSHFVNDERVMDVVRHIFDTYAVDVSYMDDNEYADCINQIHNSVAYRRQYHPQLGKRFMRKSVQVGDQMAQVIGVTYPTPIDNYVKIVKSVKGYGRYMDDSYVITRTKEEAQEIFKGIKEWANKLGIFINQKKTHITKLNKAFHFLQNSYFLTETGQVVERINPKAITRMRRKMKKFPALIADNHMTLKDARDCFISWYGARKKTMSTQQRINIVILYTELFGEDERCTI